jgi:RecA/RadA recombinase
LGVPIPIVGDQPRRDPQLGFDSYATALADAIRGGSPAQFTIGIYGPWGSGKSTLLNGIAAKLNDDQAVVPVLFDAWRYEATGHIILPLLHAVYSEVGNANNGRLVEKVRSALISLLRSVTISIGPVSIAGQGLVQSGSDTERIASLDAAFARPFADMQAIGSALDGQRIAVLIDDLDRCSAQNVVGLLEAINLVMDIPGFVFVLALDYDVLVQAVAERYPHASGHVFIEKMVQVPFRVPRLDLPDTNFLQQLIPDWHTRSALLPPNFEEIVRDVATLGLEANPRQIKRLVNSVLVLLRVANDRAITTDPRLLAGIVGLQLRWPAEYQEFADAVHAGAPDPAGVFERDNPPSLRRYSETFFAAGTSTELYRPYIQLAQSVAVAVAAERRPSVSPASLLPRHQAHMNDVVNDLVGRGYRLAGGSGVTLADIYVRRSDPDLRILVGDTFINFEVRVSEDTWRRFQSYSATNGASALQLDSNPGLMLRKIKESTSGLFGPQVRWTRFLADLVQQNSVFREVADAEAQLDHGV